MNVSVLWIWKNGQYRCFNGRCRIIDDDLYPTSSMCLDDNCQIIYQFQYVSLLFGYVRFIYLNKTLKLNSFILPDYICYNPNRCVDFFLATYHISNLTCYHNNQSQRYSSMDMFIENIRNTLFRLCLTSMNKIVDCNNHRNLNQCLNSTKCISKQRLLDGFSDCPLNDIHQRFKCPHDEIDRCFSSITILDGKRNCQN